MKAWIARDYDIWGGSPKGHAYIYFHEKPCKQVIREMMGTWNNHKYYKILLREEDIPEGIDPHWEDEEPIEVELAITIK